MVVDNATNFTWSIFIKKKSDLPTEMMKLCEEIESKMDYKIKKL